MQKQHRLNTSVWLSFLALVALVYMSWAIYDDELNHANEFMSGGQLWIAVGLFCVIAILNGVAYMVHRMLTKERGEPANKLATRLILLIVIGMFIGPAIAYFAVDRAKEGREDNKIRRQMCLHSEMPNDAYCK